MLQAVPIYHEDEAFYVPRFEVKIAGRQLPDAVVRDVLEVSYVDNVEEIDAFEIRLNNWDAERRRPKYEPPSTAEREGLFDPGERLELRMGYVRGGGTAPEGGRLSELNLMLTGQITSLEPDFPASGGLTLSVRGLNELHSFRTEQHTHAWEEMTDSRIAEDIGSRPRSRSRPGLGIEVRTAPLANEPEEPYVFMDNQFDIVFLMNRARRHGYEVVLKEERREGESEAERYVYFGPTENRGEPPAPMRLEWGRSLVSFRPTLTTAFQVSEVVVRSWDRRTNRRIEGSAKWQDLVRDRREKERLQNLARAFGDRREIVTDRPVHTRRQATEMAKDILRDQLKGMVKASGKTVGLPTLRSGRKVEITGLGSRFDGDYFVTKTTHSIGDGGYTTDFEARREGGAERTAAAAAGEEEAA